MILQHTQQHSTNTRIVMALDPLKFQVAIQDEATGQLDKIEQEFKKLQDKTINVKVEGLQDLKNLLSALQQKQVETLGKDVAAGIHDAAKGLQEEAQKAVRASLGQLAQDLVAVKTAIQHDNFTAFSTRIEKCAQAVNTLDAAFKQFHITIGADAGMRNFMTGLGEVIRNVRTTMGTLHGSNALEITPDAMSRSFMVANQEAKRLQNELVRAQRVIDTFGDRGFNVASLERYKMALLEVRNNLDLIKNNGGMHPLTGLTASQYLSQEDVSRTKSLLNDELSLYRQIGTELERMTRLRNQLSDTLKHNPNTSYGADLKNFIAGLDLRMGLVGRLGAQDGLTSMKLKSLFTDDYREQLAAVRQLLKAVTNEQKSNAQATKQAQADNDRWAESIRRASVELPKLEMQIKSLQGLEKTSRAAGIDTTNLSAKIAELQNLHRVLESIAGGAKLHGTAGEFINSAQYQNAVRFANEEASAVRQTAIEKEKAARASQQLSSEEQRLAQALNQTTESAKGQSQVLSDLKSMATQYLGVWGGQQFLHNIIEIGGQLEMQRLSIGAILQNQGQANELFNQIKGLAVQSPFGVVQLDQMTKQLTAYGFQYHELYDMTKRLADISAATGTDVSRLALALGHVRSEAALSGYTLRQFSMANVPLLEKLSEKLGKTTKEIRDMVKKKEVGYDDVIGVLKDLTDEGGMFYNMQEVISESVKAKFKNVKDAMDIMYGEMAEGAPGAALKEFASILMTLTRNWRSVGAAIAGVVIPMTVYKLSMIASNKALVEGNLALGGFTAKQLEAQAVTGNLSRQMLLRAVASQKMAVADAEAAGAVLGLTRAQLMFVAKTGNVSAAMNKSSLAVSKYTVAQLRMLATAQKSGGASLWIARMRIGLTSLKNAAESAGHALAGMARSFLPLAAISAAFSLIMRSVEAGRKAQEMANDIAEKARDSQKPIAEAFKSAEKDNLLKRIRTSDESTNGQFISTYSLKFDEDALNKADLTEKIEGLKEQLQNLSPMYEGDLLDIEKAKSQVEQYKIIMQKLESIRHMNDVNEATSDVLPNANKRVQGGNGFTRMFGDSFIEDLTDYDERMKDSVEEINQINEVELSKIDAALNGKLTEIKNNLDLSSLNEALKLYFSQGSNLVGEEATKFAKELGVRLANTGSKQILRSYYDDFLDPTLFGRSLQKQKKQLQGETEKIAKAITSTIKTHFKNDPEGAVYELKNFFDKMFTEAGVTDDTVMQETMNKILQDMENMLPDNMRDSIINAFQRKQVMIRFSDIINTDEVSAAKTEEDLDKLFNSYLEKIQAWAEIMGIDLKKIGLNVGGKFFEGFRQTFDSKKDAEQLKEDWQKRAENVFSKNTTIKGKISVETDMDVFAQAVQKDLKEKQEYLNRNAGHLRHTLHITADVLTDASKLRQLMYKLAVKAQDLAMEGKFEQSKSLLSIIKDELSPYYDALISVNEDKSWLRKEGYPEKDPNKGSKKGNKGNKNGNKGSQKVYKDPIAEELRERIRLLKEANTMYKEWEKLTNKTKALSIVQDEYGNIFETWRNAKTLPWKKFVADDIVDYAKYIEAISKYAEKRYNSQRNDKKLNNGKEAEALVRESKKLLNDLRLYSFEEKVKDANSAMKKTLDDLLRYWELYESLRSTSGDKDFAARLLGMENETSIDRTSADAMRRDIESVIASFGELSVPIKVDATMLDLSDREIEELVKNALGGTEHAEQIDAVVKAIKRWRELSLKVGSDDLQTLAKLKSKSKDLVSENVRIDGAAEKEKESYRALHRERKISKPELMQYEAMVDAEAEDKKWKQSLLYIRLMNNSLSMTEGEVKNGIDNAIRILNMQLEAGLITAKEYVDNMDKLRGLRDNYDKKKLFGFSSSVYTAGLTGGLDEVEKYLKGIISDNDLIINSKDSTKEEKEKAKSDKKEAEDNLKIVNKITSVISDVSFAGQALMSVFDGMSQSAKSLSEMFDALGNQSMANFFSDVSDAIGVISSFFSPVNNLVQSALKGDVGGTVSGALSAPISIFTNPITAFSQWHDKRIERQIERIRESVSVIEANISAIHRARERTLGYDDGEIRRSMVVQYQNGRDKASKNMLSYYTQNSVGTGYQQEYAALVDERARYMEILNKQEDKKKKSQSDITETEEKIAELDDQIRHFTMDLAKELWDIDIKGWADQLSDALASAFENGESMAKAYKETVTSILQGVMNKMMQMAILEPMFQSLQDKLFGYTDDNGEKHEGVFDSNDPMGSMSKVTAVISDFFGNGGEGEKTITAATEFMTAFQRGLENAGLSVLNDSANALTSSVQGTSEETSDLLAGYINALRQDVAVNRILFTQFVTQLWPEYVEAFAAHVRTVANINVNVQLMMEMMRDGKGAFFTELSSLRSRFDSVVDGIERLSVR